ncbi:MAG: hypothetical protein OEV78_00325 [Spirochaetia bacterium]|nr:hypothetical protein [Spirochaetia bacterium]
MKKIFIHLVTITISMGPIFAGAHTKGMFTVNVDNELLYGSSADSLVATLDSTAKVETFKKTMTYMADSQSMATRGLGATYATNQSIFVISPSVNAGFSPGDRGIDKFVANPMAPGASGIPEVGIGAQGSVLFGLSLKVFNIKPLGFFDPSRLTIFANFFTYQLTQPYMINTFSIGGHAQYKIINDLGLFWGLIHWGGLDITTGLDVATNKLEVPTSTYFTTQYAGGISFTPTGNFGFTNTAVTIPIEASTSIRLGYIFSLIAGVALDVNMGNSKIDLTGAINDATTGTKVGTLTTNEKSRFGASFIDTRLFFGPQINLIPLPSGKNILSITMLANISTNNIYGAHVAVNIGF